MMKVALALLIAILTLGHGAALAQQKSDKDDRAIVTPDVEIVKIPGSALKWIHATEPEFTRRKLNLENYNVTVLDEGDTIIVSLTGLHTKPGWRGNSSSFPEYSVEISKKDLKVLWGSYNR